MIGNWNIWNNLPTAESTEVHYACLQDPCNLMQVKNRFQLFVEKREKCKKNLLVTTHTVTSRYQRWGKSYRESLTLLPSEKAPPWRISSTQCKRLGVQNCWGQSNGFCFLTLNPYVCPFFDHQRYCPVHLFSSWFPCSANIAIVHSCPLSVHENPQKVTPLTFVTKSWPTVISKWWEEHFFRCHLYYLLHFLVLSVHVHFCHFSSDFFLGLETSSAGSLTLWQFSKEALLKTNSMMRKSKWSWWSRL